LSLCVLEKTKWLKKSSLKSKEFIFINLKITHQMIKCTIFINPAKEYLGPIPWWDSITRPIHVRSNLPSACHATSSPSGRLFLVPSNFRCRKFNLVASQQFDRITYRGCQTAYFRTENSYFVYILEGLVMEKAGIFNAICRYLTAIRYI
jgi:hypothetical protein